MLVRIFLPWFVFVLAAGCIVRTPEPNGEVKAGYDYFAKLIKKQLDKAKQADTKVKSSFGKTSYRNEYEEIESIMKRTTVGQNGEISDIATHDIIAMEKIFKKNIDDISLAALTAFRKPVVNRIRGVDSKITKLYERITKIKITPAQSKIIQNNAAKLEESMDELSKWVRFNDSLSTEITEGVYDVHALKVYLDDDILRKWRFYLEEIRKHEFVPIQKTTNKLSVDISELGNHTLRYKLTPENFYE